MSELDQQLSSGRAHFYPTSQVIVAELQLEMLDDVGMRLRVIFVLSVQVEDLMAGQNGSQRLQVNLEVR
jgi:hypothetical protein